MDFLADAPAPQHVDAAAQLSRVAQMAETLTEAQREVAQCEGQLEEAERTLRRIAREDYPELLREVGLTEVTLPDRRKIVLADGFDCGISEENKPAAFAWLRDNGFGGLIKTEVTVAFGRSEQDELERLLKLLEEHGFIAAVGDSVHWQTLKSFIKERKEAGEPVPADLFGVHDYAEVDVKHPRGSNGFKLKRIFKKK